MELAEAVRIVEENDHWLYKQASEELHRAILAILLYARAGVAGKKANG